MKKLLEYLKLTPLVLVLIIVSILTPFEDDSRYFDPYE